MRKLVRLSAILKPEICPTLDFVGALPLGGGKEERKILPAR